MEKEQAKKIIEALLYMADHALSPHEISQVLEQKSFTEDIVREMVNEIAQQYDANGSPIRIVEVAGGFQAATRPDMAPWIRRMYKERLTVRLSPSSLETLSIIAYKQPITRGDVEQIRGVEASGVMETLLERRLVKVVGRKETIGRPLLYGTTIEFLRHFGLKHLSELPDLNTMVIPESIAGEIDQQELPLPIESDGVGAAPEEATAATAVLEAPAPDIALPDAETKPELN